MKPSRAALVAALFFLLAPGLVAGVGPWWISHWRPGRYDSAGLRVAGAVVLALGVAGMLDTFVRFVRARGTPSPTHPTERLVLSGPYRFTRNPMYLAVAATIVGQALLLGRADLLAYAAVIAIAFHLRVVTYEEPSLRRRFGAQYERYCADVPRWGIRLPGLPRAP
ncbi:MAG TPA: isoprenylcysteine carboxylmethyltransferase family protein [Longimicrobiales bacterium]